MRLRRAGRPLGVLVADGGDDVLVRGEHVVFGAVQQVLVHGQEEIGAHGVHGERQTRAVRGRGDAAVDAGVRLEQGGAPAVVVLFGQRPLEGIELLCRAAGGGEFREPPLDGDAELEDVVELAAVLGHPAVPALLKLAHVAHARASVRPARGDEVAGALERAQCDAQRDAGDAEQRGELRGRRQTVARPQLAPEDERADVPLGALARRPWGERHVVEPSVHHAVPLPDAGWTIAVLTQNN